MPALVTERLPGLAEQLKQISLDTIGFFTGKSGQAPVNQVQQARQVQTPGQVSSGSRPGAGRTSPGRTTPGRTVPGQAAPGQAMPGQAMLGRMLPAEEGVIPASQNIFYAIADSLVMNARCSTVKSFAKMNGQKTAEMFGDYRKFISALSDSDLFLFFMASPGREDRRFELKSYLEKFLKDNDEAVGFELRNPQGVRLLASAKTLLDLPEVPLRGDFGMSAFPVQRQVFVVFAKRIGQADRDLGTFSLAYRSDIFRALALPEKFDTTLLVLNSVGQLVYARSREFDANRIDRLKSSFASGSLPLSVNFENTRYRVVYGPTESGFRTAYLYKPVALSQVILNVLVIVLAAGLAVFLVWLCAFLYRSVWLKSRSEKIRKDEIITGTISEMVKTLKSTAELTAKMAENTREDLGMLERTISRIQGRAPEAAEEELGKSGEPDADDWEAVNK